jgi:hypothetical protein
MIKTSLHCGKKGRREQAQEQQVSGQGEGHEIEESNEDVNETHIHALFGSSGLEGRGWAVKSIIGEERPSYFLIQKNSKVNLLLFHNELKQLSRQRLGGKDSGVFDIYVC